MVPRDAEPQRGARTGLHEMGLPYVSDPAITRHLAAFLKKQLQRPRQLLLTRSRPTGPAILCSTAASFSRPRCASGWSK